MRRLGPILQSFAALDPSSAPDFQLNGRQREQLLAWISMTMHKLHFTGFGQPNQPDASLTTPIKRDFGAHDR